MQDRSWEAMYFIMVDAFSKWREIFKMTSTTSSATIDKLREIFSRLGIPTERNLRLHNEFSNFCSVNGIQHLKTPPFHPQSNGQAEKFVDIFKRVMLQLKEEETSTMALSIFFSAIELHRTCTAIKINHTFRSHNGS